MLVIPEEWLRRLTTHHGPGQRDDPDLLRWTWQDGEWGVFVDRLTHVWQTVAWSPHRSATLRTEADPTDDDILAVALLADFIRHPETP